MIFGFNTDVKSGATVYHVQSEARQADLLLQTQVFVKGRCIGKKATSFAHLVNGGTFSEDELHAMLKTQHKNIVDAVRGGTVEKMFAAEPAVQDVNGQGLAVSWTNADAVFAEGGVVMRFQVTDGGAGVAGAKLVSRLSLSSQDPIYSQAATDEQGIAEIRISVANGDLADAAVLVQATHGDKTATRKFRLRKRD